MNTIYLIVASEYAIYLAAYINFKNHNFWNLKMKRPHMFKINSNIYHHEK